MQHSPSFYTINCNCDLPRVEHDASDTPLAGAEYPRSYCAFVSPDGKYTANVWACDSGTLRIDDLSTDEACFLIEGSVEIIDDAGNREIYRAGDAFLLPKGFSGIWHMPEPVVKYNTMYTR